MLMSETKMETNFYRSRNQHDCEKEMTDTKDLSFIY
jgi:hypothetical protein